MKNKESISEERADPEDSPNKGRQLFHKIGKVVLELFKNKPAQKEHLDAPNPDTQPSEHDSETIQEQNRQEIEEDKEEAEALEQFLDLMHRYRRRYLKERREFLYDQQVIERELNSRLTKVESLEELSRIESSGVEKRSIPFIHPENGLEYEITVYDLKGLPYELLTSEIGIGSGNGLARERLKHPELWMMPLREAKTKPQWLKQHGYTDTVSASYSNSGKNFGTALTNGTDYGFDHVRPNSVRLTSRKDGGTPGETRDAFSVIDNSIGVRHLKDFPSKSESGIYNEIAFSRYDEAGEPIPPDYILTRNDNISEIDKLHAHYFGIPIINIDDRTYKTLSEEVGKSIINSINPECSYEELFHIIEQLRELPCYDKEVKPVDSLGSGDWPKGSSWKQDLYDCLRLEGEKRFELMKRLLKEKHPNIKVERISIDKDNPNFYSIDCLNGEGYPYTYYVPGYQECDAIVLKSKDGTIPTLKVLNGEQMDKDEYPDSTGEYYRELLPLVEEYFSTHSKNGAS